MAKRRRTTPRAAPKRTTTRSREEKLVIGDNPVGMPPPNHLVALDCDSMEDLPLYMRWPLVLLMHEDCDRDEPELAFVDAEQHQVSNRYEYANHPPTWMDPHVFAGMVMADERVQKICRVAMKKNDPDAWKQIYGLLDEIFDTEYLPYVLEKFEKASPLLAKWVLRCHAYRETDPCKPKKTRRRK